MSSCPTRRYNHILYLSPLPVVSNNHALQGTKPLRRASLTNSESRAASALATSVPNGVIR